jgi:hypothetical protein
MRQQIRQWRAILRLLAALDPVRLRNDALYRSMTAARIMAALRPERPVHHA